LVLAAQLEHQTAAAITDQILFLVHLRLWVAVVAALTLAHHLQAVRAAAVLLVQIRLAQAEHQGRVLQAAMVLK
jgi:hypothetical protein